MFGVIVTSKPRCQAPLELELQYLYELQRTTQPGSVVVDTLEEEIGLSRCKLPFAQVISEALNNNWTRDPFDRIVVAQAQVRQMPLLTRDSSIRDHYTEAIWFD
jgi:PIN domain nuclease of toxin-antitoxin system